MIIWIPHPIQANEKEQKLFPCSYFEPARGRLLSLVGILKITPRSEQHPYIWFVIAVLFLITSFLNFRKHTASKNEAVSQ